MRHTNSHPLPAGWDWAAKALDFSAPEPIIREIPGGEAVVVQTILRTKASNAAPPMLTLPMEPRSAGAVHAQPAVKSNDTTETQGVFAQPSTADFTLG